MSNFRKIQTAIRLLGEPKREQIKVVYRYQKRIPAIADNILLVGSPRSGTTWVGNVLGLLPGFFRITEPLSLGTHGLREVGFTWNTVVHPDESWEKGKPLLEQVLAGQLFNTQALDDNTIAQVFLGKSALLKVVRGNRLLPWITNNFTLRSIFFLIRHPCAVVSSQVLHPLFPYYDKAANDDLEFIDRYLPDLSGYARSLHTEVECRALTWALDQCFPLLFDHNGKWASIRYELLVQNGIDELQCALHGTGYVVSKKMRRELNMASREAHAWSAQHGNDDITSRLGGWHQRLDESQVKGVLDVVEKIGITGFSDQLIPDYDSLRLNRTLRL